MSMNILIRMGVKACDCCRAWPAFITSLLPSLLTFFACFCWSMVQKGSPVGLVMDPFSYRLASTLCAIQTFTRIAMQMESTVGREDLEVIFSMAIVHCKKLKQWVQSAFDSTVQALEEKKKNFWIPLAHYPEVVYGFWAGSLLVSAYALLHFVLLIPSWYCKHTMC